MCTCVNKQMCVSCANANVQNAGLCMRDGWRASKTSPLLLVVSYYCYCRRVSRRERKAGVRRVARRFRYSPSSSCSRFRANSGADRRMDFLYDTGRFSARKTQIFLTFLSSLYETLLASPRLVVPAAIIRVTHHFSNISVISLAISCPSLENASAIRNISEQRRGERMTLSRLDSRRRM